MKVTAQSIHKMQAHEVFGKISCAAELTMRFRELSRQLHPDVGGDNDAQARLSALREMAETQLLNGTYGRGTVIKGKAEYQSVVPLAAGDICDVYTGVTETGEEVILKKLRERVDQDLFKNEVAVLREMYAQADAAKWAPWLPRVLEVFSLDASVAVLTRQAGTSYTLAEVKSMYPDGIDARDVVWMVRRVLEVLSYAHRLGIAHGAIIPEHVVIRPEDHLGRLVDWSYATKGALKAKVSGYPCYYPSDLSGPELDTYMVASLMDDMVDKHVPRDIRNFIEAGLLVNRSRRFQNAEEMYAFLDKTLRKVYGPPSFHVFKMPGGSNGHK